MLTSQTGRRLRVGILLSNGAQTLPKWVAAWSDELQKEGLASLETVAITSAPTPRAAESRAFQIYRKLIGERLGPLADPLAPAAIPDGVAVVRAFPPDGTIDVLIAADPVDPAHLPALGYGVWWPDWGGDPPYFWEARDNQPVSGVTLRARWPGRTDSVVIDAAVVPTDRTIYAGRNRVAPLWTAADMVCDSLRRLHAGNLETAAQAADAARALGPRKGTPGLASLAAWVMPALAEKVFRRLRRSPELVSDWRVAVRRGGDLLAKPRDFSGFSFIPAPHGRFYADPFPIHAGEDCWLFVEDYVRADGKAVLSCGRLSADLQMTDVRVILDRPYHLSFPHVFEHGGRWYMMPESNANGTLDLYVADSFPYEWRWLKTLRHGKLVDATVLFSEDGVWWFVTEVEPRGRGMKLLLFRSETLDGEWQPHPANPLSRDARTARGAGAIFSRGGRLYRPGQDCGPRYGYGFRINEILNVNAARYSEREALFAEPSWAPEMAATHTYNRSRDVEAVDANWFVPRQS